MIARLLFTLTFCALFSKNVCRGENNSNDVKKKLEPPAVVHKYSRPLYYDTLKLLHVLFRHGDRTPALNERYPKDPYYNETYFPIGYGQLTTRGKRLEYVVGDRLREKYWRFLGDTYFPEVMDARTTDYNRTKMSLQLVLSGLWPPKAAQCWHPYMYWQPIPYNYWRLEEDDLLHPITACPQLKELYNEYLNSEEFKEKDAKNKDLYKYVSENTGLRIQNPEDIYNLYFCLYAEQELNFTLPEWTRSVWPEKLTQVVYEYYDMMSHSNEILSYGAGILLRKIIEDTSNHINGTLTPPERKLFLYSAHEINIALMLTALGVYFPHVPDYGSYIVFELHEIYGGYRFKIFYQDYTSREPRQLEIPGCEKFCEFDYFYNKYADLFPKEECT